jgi:hypothetical protein
MSKGSIGERAIFLVIAVVAFLVFIFIIWKIAPNVIKAALISLGIVKPSNIEQAILCSIHRCVDGCMSMRVQEISWKDGDKTVSCQNFCNVPDDAYNKDLFGNIESQLRVCNPNYPINITLKSVEKIEKSHLTLISTSVSDVRCILPNPRGGPNAWDAIKFILGGAIWQQLVNLWTVLTGSTVSDNWLIVDTELIKSYGEKEDCVAQHTGFTVSHDSLKELIIKNNQKIGITTSFGAFGPYNAVATSVFKIS